MTFIVRPPPKRRGRFHRSTRKEYIHALPSLLVRRSSYYKTLLESEFQEGTEGSHPELSCVDEQAESDDSTVEERPYVEDWLDYYSDSDADYYDEDEEEARKELDEVSFAAPGPE